jgi:hypothetical protein
MRYPHRANPDHRVEQSSSEQRGETQGRRRCCVFREIKAGDRHWVKQLSSGDCKCPRRAKEVVPRVGAVDVLTAGGRWRRLRRKRPSWIGERGARPRRIATGCPASPHAPAKRPAAWFQTCLAYRPPARYRSLGRRCHRTSSVGTSCCLAFNGSCLSIKVCVLRALRLPLAYFFLDSAGESQGYPAKVRAETLG